MKIKTHLLHLSLCSSLHLHLFVVIIPFPLHFPLHLLSPLLVPYPISFQLPSLSTQCVQTSAHLNASSDLFCLGK